jgi:hypothetical protein
MHLAVELGIFIALALNLVLLTLGIRALTRGLETLAETVRALGTRSDPTGRSSSEARPIESDSVTSPPSEAHRLDAVRAALRDDDLVKAQALLGGLSGGVSASQQAELAAMSAEISRRKETAIGHLRASLEAARSVSDPDGVLTIHGQLASLVSQVEREALDREQVRWFVGLLMRRMRSGTVRTDVAVLAQRVAEAFPTQPEGASLRASLPTLRRSAGLCAACGRSYKGIDDACPECLRDTECNSDRAADAAWKPADDDLGDEVLAEAGDEIPLDR